MSEPLEFDEAAARREAAIYETPAIVERRERVRAALDLDPGDAVCSIGCGPGYEPAELARVVGEEGTVLGIDRSGAMLALARDRCREFAQVTLARADAGTLPVADRAFDAAVAVQVYEYLEDVPAALRALRRALRPGGRAVVYDTDFDSLVWRSADQQRMERVRETFTDHCRHPHLGSRLAPIAREAGLTVETVEPYSILGTRFDEDTFVYHLARAHRDYLVEEGILSEAEATAWIDDLRERDSDGGTFFDLTQYLYVLERPA